MGNLHGKYEQALRGLFTAGTSVTGTWFLITKRKGRRQTGIEVRVILTLTVLITERGIKQKK